MSLSRQIRQAGRRHGSGTIGERQIVGQRAVIPAPVRGLNAIDGVANMPRDYAVALDNYFPDKGGVRLRRGFTSHATGVDSSAYVETLVPHYSGSLAKLYAIGGGNLHDASTAAAVGTALKTGLTNSRWSHATIGGQTILVNGADDPMRIQADGTLAAAHGWTGITTASDLRRVIAFKNRAFFLEKDTATLRYGGLRAVQGALTSFDLSYVSPHGGNCLEIGSMTIDSGTGIDDLFLVFMQHGIVLVYQGIDPSQTDSTGFRIIGEFRIGELIGDRPLIQFGADLLALTVDGLVSMSAMLQAGRTGRRAQISLSEQVSPLIRDLADEWGDTPGWDLILHPQASWLLISIPAPNGVQLVMNTQTGAWCRFTGIDARCWTRFQDRLFFGGNAGAVNEADRSNDDGDTPIEGDVQTAYNYIGRGLDTRVSLIRALVESDGDIAIGVGATTDFERPAPLNAPVAIVTSSAVWGSATWGVSEWGSTPRQSKAWQVVNRTGAAVSVRLRTSTRGASVALFATDVQFTTVRGIR